MGWNIPNCRLQAGCESPYLLIQHAFLCLHRLGALPPETMQYSLQVDIYSYGVVLWELVTRCTPRIGGMREVHVPHECPQVVADLIAWCLCPEPHERPSAHQVLALLAPKCGPLCNLARV